ncbi:MAG TPA: hypothetical protein PKD78_12115 [Saprospiraceae bacterium]|nr:hypothetical protein [Saprospiraceae bacterium]HNG89985.1 hypothetical protein [Saprospiraceae bacterium]
MMHRPIACGLFLLFILGSTYAQQPPDTAQTPSVFEYFQRAEILQFSLELDVDALLTERDSNLYRPALMRYTDQQGLAQSVSVEVKPKGHSRRKICDVPPLKLRFQQDFLTANGLHPASGLVQEMVLNCKSDDLYEQYVLREYLAYRLYNTLTDRSLKVQLVKLSLLRKGQRKPFMEGYAFLIEPQEDLARRLKAKLLTPRYITPKTLQAGDFDRLSVFQFMIGNTDWYIYNRHNACIMQCPSDSLPIAVPYDFDYCGLVDAPYAVAAPRLKFRKVTVRYFLGLCRRPEEWAPTLQLFEDKKTALLEAAQEVKDLNKASRRHSSDYLEAFFAILADPQQLKEQIIEHCGIGFIK